MKNQLLAVAVAAALGFGSAPSQAASNEELTQIRSQLEGLIQRVDRLETENETLKTENSQLKATTEQVVAKQSAEASKPAAPAVKVADWPNRVAIKGDIRYRHQETDDESATHERDEDVLRARLSLEGKVNDAIVAGFGLTTSSAPGNPRGANQQLDGGFSRKPLYLDLAYFDWAFIQSANQNAHLIGGKMKMPFFRPGQSFFWDNDINPEGLAFTYGTGSLFGSAWGYWVEENVQTGTGAAATTTSTDTKMFGVQVGNRFKFSADDNLVIAGSYYDLAAAKGRRPLYNGSANGNSLTTAGLAYDFSVVDLMAEYNTKLGDLPLQVWADAARNLDSTYDTAYGFGAVVGKAANPGSWETGLAYQLIEKDALYAQHIDSDFAAGLTDSAGWVVRAGYAPLKNWVLCVTYYASSNNRDVGTEYDYKRLLLDFNAKF